MYSEGLKYCRINNYLYHASALHKIKTMNYLSVHQCSQSEVNFQDHSCDIF